MIPYIKSSWRAGISDEYTRGVRGSFKYAYGVDIHKRRDSLSCNWAMANIADGLNDLIKYSVVAKDGSTYAFGSHGSIYAISGNIEDPVVTGVYTDENGEIFGAAEWGLDDGVNYLYWATATSLARMAMDGSVDTPWVAGVVTQDYKTTLDSHPYHTMRPANGSLCIANGQYLATIGYDGAFDPAAFNIRPGNTIKCLEERDDYIIVGSERVDNSEQGYIWTWNVVGDAWTQKRKIPVKGINALIDTERLLLQGGTDGELFYSDFVNASPLNSVPLKGQCNPQVDIYDDRALFGMYGSTDTSYVGLYSYGRKMINRPFALNNEFRLTKTISGSTVANIGCVWTNDLIPYASWQTADESTTEYGIDMVSNTTRASARIEGLEFNGGSPHLKKIYKSEKLIFEPLPASCGISLIYKQDRGSWRYAYLADGSSTTYSVEGSTECEFIINAQARTFEIGLELTPNGTDTPEITGHVGYISDQTDEH